MIVIDSRVSSMLATAAVLVLTSGSVAQVCGDPDAGDCCVANGLPACDDAECCDAVCAADPFCCVVEWDDICAQQAADVCNLPCTPSLCPLLCPPGAIHEDEPCGGDTNGGCNSLPPVYTLAACGLTFCGTAWADGGVRDTDWYLFDLPDPDGDGMETITATLISQFPGSCVIADVGGGDCTVLEQVGSLGCGDGCENIAVASATLPAPGTYAVFVAPGLCDFGDIAEGYPCGDGSNSYVLTIECAATCDIDGAIALLDIALPVQDNIVSGFESAGGNLDAADVQLTDSDGQLAIVETQLDAADGLMASAETELATADTDLASTQEQIKTASTAVGSAMTNATVAAAAADQAAVHFDQVATLARACSPCSDPAQTTLVRSLVKLGQIVTQLATATGYGSEALAQLFDAAAESTLAQSQAQQASQLSAMARAQTVAAWLKTIEARSQQQQAKSDVARAKAKSDQAFSQSAEARALSIAARFQLALPISQTTRTTAKMIGAWRLNNRAAAKGTASAAQSADAVTLTARAATKQQAALAESGRAAQKSAQARALSDRSDARTQAAAADFARSETKLASAAAEKRRAAEKAVEILDQALGIFTLLADCGACDAALAELSLAEDAVLAAAAGIDLAIQDIADATADVGGATAAASAASSALQNASADLAAAELELTGAETGLGDSLVNTDGAILDTDAAIIDLQDATGDIDVVDPLLLEAIGLLSACPDCPWDLDLDGLVGINDFLGLLAAWGPNPDHPADFDDDGIVGINDFLALLANWGPCPVP